MTGLSTFAATKRSLVGIDWLNLTSGALKSAGGAFGGGDAAALAAEKARLEEQRRAAEERAATWKLVGIVGICAVLGVVIVHQRSV